MAGMDTRVTDMQKMMQAGHQYVHLKRPGYVVFAFPVRARAGVGSKSPNNNPTFCNGARPRFAKGERARSGPRQRGLVRVAPQPLLARAAAVPDLVGGRAPRPRRRPPPAHSAGSTLLTTVLSAPSRTRPPVVVARLRRSTRAGWTA